MAEEAAESARETGGMRGNNCERGETVVKMGDYLEIAQLEKNYFRVNYCKRGETIVKESRYCKRGETIVKRGNCCKMGEIVVKDGRLVKCSTHREMRFWFLSS